MSGEKSGATLPIAASKASSTAYLPKLRGLPVSLVIDGANRHDMKLTRASLAAIIIPCPDPTPAAPQNFCLDKGDDYDEVRELAETFGYTAHIRARGEEAQAIKQKASFKARRWVVERTHSWMNLFRQILTR